MCQANNNSASRAVILTLTCASLIAIGGCSRQQITDFSGQDITSLASRSLSAISGQKSADEINANVDIRTRSPLVMPPSNTLQTPGSSDQTPELLSGQWPNDPDVAARQAAEDERTFEREVQNRQHRQALTETGQSQPMSVAELKRGRSARRGENLENVSAEAPRRSEALSPEELLGRRLDPERVRERRIAQQTYRRSSKEQLITPPGLYDAPPQDPNAVAQEPEKKSIWRRMQFWKRN